MTIEVSPSVVTRDVAGEIMLLDLEHGTYFGLDPIGAEIWKALESGETLDAVLERLGNEFDVSPIKLRADADALIRDLAENKLVLAAD